MDQTTSKKYKLTKANLESILIGALIAGGGALLTYASQTITQIDFGTYTPLAVALGGILINAGRKFLDSKE